MAQSVMRLLISCTLLLTLHARLVQTSRRGSRSRAFQDLMGEQNDIDNQELELLKRLMKQISEGPQSNENVKPSADKCARGSYSDEDKAKKWLRGFNATQNLMSQEIALATWNYATNITNTTAQLRENATLGWLPWSQNATSEGNKFFFYKKCFRDASLVRQLQIIAVCGSRPSPDDKRLTELHTQMETQYSSATVQDDEGTTYRLEPELTELFATSRNYDDLAWAWRAWRDATGPQGKDTYEESVALETEAVGDIGKLWRTCNYGEPLEETKDNKDLFVENIVDDLLEQVKPLYMELHAYVRYKLRQLYPEQAQTDWFKQDDSPIPAHLLGNMWAQEWGIYDLMEPYPDAGTIDVTEEMVRQNWTVHQMFQTAESFFTSLGLEPMTNTFWEKSMTTRPTDGREVVCHASAEDFSTQTDFRIKMCAEIKQTDLQTVHHEMGHIEYFMAYRNQTQLYRQGANAAFHEAIGDTIALSVMTPEHLTKLGLLKTPDSTERNINFLMKMALNKVAFLPFAYLVDKWRWEVFSEKVTKSQYNKRWWELRLQHQGVAPPVTRSEEDFDPLAKYHIAANVPYIRYFLSFLGQFQFHRGLCSAAGHTGDLFACDIFESRQAGRKLRSALELGSSKPWPEVMQILTGSRKFDASAIQIYFRPLKEWLGRYRREHGYKMGWNKSRRLFNKFFES